jgi:hypothetical protein
LRLGSNSEYLLDVMDLTSDIALCQPPDLPLADHVHRLITGDATADWSDVFALVPSLEVGYVWHPSKLTREVLDGLLRIGFLHDGLGLVLFAPVGNAALPPVLP